MRDIPESVPNLIAERVYERFGDMKALADHVGLPYTSVYSVLVKSSLRPVQTLQRLSKPLGISPDELAAIFLISNLELRQRKLESLLAGKSLSQWAREAGLEKSTVCRAVNNLEQTQINNVVKIAAALGLDLKRFSAHFERCKLAG